MCSRKKLKLFFSIVAEFASGKKLPSQTSMRCGCADKPVKPEKRTALKKRKSNRASSSTDLPDNWSVCQSANPILVQSSNNDQLQSLEDGGGAWRSTNLEDINSVGEGGIRCAYRGRVQRDRRKIETSKCTARRIIRTSGAFAASRSDPITDSTFLSKAHRVGELVSVFQKSALFWQTSSARCWP